MDSALSVAIPSRLKRIQRRFGLRGLLSIVLTLAALSIFVFSSIPSDKRLIELRQQAQSLRELARQSSGISASGAHPRSQLEQFHQLLPEAASAPAWLARIFDAAKKSSLSLDQGEYRTMPENKGRYTAYQIHLPVRGSYVQIRTFLSEVLRSVPSLALDDIVLKRDSISRSEVDANIRFTLFLARS